MPGLSVVIPFFQRQPGILERALRSVRGQDVPPGWIVEIVIVDDASPVPASDDLGRVAFVEPFRPKVIQQENRGVGAARNRGLVEASKDSSLIAFLDSDDIWPAHHLRRAIEAIGQGFDFYFTDNRRIGRHESYCRASPFAPRMSALIKTSKSAADFLEISPDMMVGLTLMEFPCQASTVVYRRSIAPGLLFDVALKYTGEDVLFFTTLGAMARKTCFDLDSMVECSDGVNIYFSNLTPDGARFLAIKVDKYVTHGWIERRLTLSDRNSHRNSKWLARSRADLTYHLFRGLFTRPTDALQQFVRLTWMAPTPALSIFGEAFRLGRKSFVKKMGSPAN